VRRLRAGEAGYSLIELLVVLVILGTVLGGLTTVFVSGSKAELDMNLRFQAQQNARLALSRVRIDVHLAGCVSTGSASTISLYSTPATPGACTGSPTVTWCTAASAQLAGRWTLYRASGATCNSSVGLQIANYLTTSSLFTTNTPTAGSKQRASVSVSFPVSTNTTNSNLDRYQLQDTIVLRNAPQA
jgi:prepilin-type N-terminal cleavage/methylation domain-containing protein